MKLSARTRQRLLACLLIVGFFGGSFAEDVAYTAAGTMIEELKPLYPGKEIVVVKGAMAGYKQPQQLMAYNYFSALGGDFDLVVNLDGSRTTLSELRAELQDRPVEGIVEILTIRDGVISRLYP